MKYLVITGASSGIGNAIVETFCKQGWSVLMVARNQERLEQIKSLHQNSDYFLCDLSQATEVANLTKKIIEHNSSLDALINCAGIYRPQAIEDDEDSVWEEQYQSNLMSAVRLTRGLWPILKKSSGAIVNISSTLAIRPIANTAAYSAIKAAMNNWTLSLALEGAAHGIRANSICPGIIDTPIHKFFNSTEETDKELYKSLQQAQPLGRTGKPQDISGMAFQLCSKESAWTTGSVINIDGGILLNS